MTEPSVIILVDDDIDFLEVNTCILEAAGYTVTCFTDPRKALEHMNRVIPDLLISDLMMGTFDSGFSLARTIKEDSRFSHIPIMIVSAVSSQLGFNFSPRSSEELQAMHADAFLSKPIEPDAFIAVIQDLLDESGKKEEQNERGNDPYPGG